MQLSQPLIAASCWQASRAGRPSCQRLVRPQMSTTHYCSTDPGTSFTKDDGYAIGGIVSRPQPPLTPLDPCPCPT